MEESLTPISPAVTRIVLTDADKEKLIQLGSLRWPEEKIAAFFGWDLRALKAELADSESEISRLLLQGELQADFKLEARLLSDAQNGSLAAAKQFGDLVRDRSFKLAKLDLFGGSDDKELFEKIQKYVDDGCPGDLSTKEQLYIDALQMIYSMTIKFGERKTLKLLTREPYSLKYDRAKDMICEAMELFNGGRRVSKDAMRHHLAETYDALYHTMLETARTNQDLVLAASILDRKAKILQLDKPDEPEIPIAQYQKVYRVLSLSPEALGLPAANRDELAAQIDALEIPDTEKKRLRMEAGVIDTDIVKMMRNVVQEEDQ